jgi:hypothetical protein
MNPNGLETIWHFRTIGLGTFNYRAASKRLAREVSSTGLFQTSLGHDEKFIKKFSPVFWKNHQNILKARTHGFGWFIWKPEFIKLCLAQIPKGHGLMYCDAGNQVSSKKTDIETLKSYLNLAHKNQVVGSNSQNFIEEEWSSKEIIDFFALTENDKKSNQFLGGFLLVVNSDEGSLFVKEWGTTACLDKHKYLLPSLVSQTNEISVNHRHDQSILSCMLKKQSKPSVKIGDQSIPGCIRAVRHRYGYGYGSSNYLKIVFFRVISIFSRVRLALERRIIKNSLYLRPLEHK